MAESYIKKGCNVLNVLWWLGSESVTSFIFYIIEVTYQQGQFTNLAAAFDSFSYLHGTLIEFSLINIGTTICFAL